MAAIARACAEKRIDARVTVVVSDRPGVAGIATARDLGIETHVVPWQGVEGRAEFERALAEQIDQHGANLVILAGFMRVLSPEFVERYAGRILNIHPSLLPRYRGLHTHHRVLAAKDPWHGASVHFVTA